MRRAAASFLEELLDAVYPPHCAVCGRGTDGGLGCAEHALPDPAGGPPGARCGRCAARLPELFPDGALCAACRRRPPRFHGVIALDDYRESGALRAWILALKHGRRRELAEPLGHLLGQRLLASGALAEEACVLVPVPLHPLRRLERGFDQALLLARAVAAAADLPLFSILARRRWTPPQGTPGARSRSANVRTAFALARRARGLPRGHRVLLVDDVVTSGATADACARALGGLGARRTGVLCLARAGP